jgi:hypothetical protein
MITLSVYFFCIELKQISDIFLTDPPKFEPFFKGHL